MALKIGLTGGIGSGKTTVATIFKVLGVPVYNADDAAKKIMNEDSELKRQIMMHFGSEAYINNTLNRSHLSSIVFNDPDKLTLLNSLVHPVTIADADSWMLQQRTPYIIKEAALMFESDAYKHVDYVIGVSAPETLRIQRTMQRDGITEEAVKTRMSKQLDEEEKMKRCNFIVYNDEEKFLIPQVLQLHEKFLTLKK